MLWTWRESGRESGREGGKRDEVTLRSECLFNSPTLSLCGCGCARRDGVQKRKEEREGGREG